MRVRNLIAATILFVVCIPTIALAASTGNDVVIPYGQYIADAATAGVSVAGALIAWAIRLLPARYIALIQATHADQILTKAVSYALNAVPGAVQGKSLTIDIANPVIREAVTYVIANGPKWLIGWLGGEAGITQKIIARLSLEENAGVQMIGNNPVLVAAK